ncbi:threonine/serine exporter family protein [Furfurilactobacillus siliginis]|uniref:Membrane protein n=1 Tax=Furfurilactobacillus siliginis TaxID=348151 RepID=A0A0R2KXR2_9LACO|nr:threonine/serine exporter family protein [Furfurilactobacillus siliginis]KRN94225.1 integral membrane protein [Furfurilactobacillus siliginis]GEK29253.1 membrane protein [Furfurilactobacillus siliginis]
MEETELVMNTALLAGEILLENGAEIARVEDTMMRISTNEGYANANVFVLLTGITMSLPDGTATQVRPVHSRTLDLEKVDQVNTLSRQFASDEIDVPTFYQQLRQVKVAVPTFPFWLQLIAAVVVSVTLMLAFTGLHQWLVVLLTALAGATGYGVFYLINHELQIRFLSEFLAALVIGAIADAGVAWLALSRLAGDAVIIGALMPLVPGVPLMNAFRDTMAGNYLSGPARAVEAILSVCAIGLGIAIMVSLR